LSKKPQRGEIFVTQSVKTGEELFTRFPRCPAGKLISCGALWAIDILNPYNSIVYKKPTLKRELRGIIITMLF
jgi:hypothetical protein